jgi:hypothetical protein
VLLASRENFPDSQFVHDDKPGTDVKVPAAQSEQDKVKTAAFENLLVAQMGQMNAIGLQEAGGEKKPKQRVAPQHENLPETHVLQMPVKRSDGILEPHFP